MCENPSRKYHKCGVYCFEGSRLWQISPPMLSLYTLLMRAGFAHNKDLPWSTTVSRIRADLIDPYQSLDTEQLIDARNGMQKILRLGPRRIFHKNIRRNYPEDIPIETMHNELGIVSFSQGSTAELVPYWNRYDS
jgi:hypothetical protein